ncbi:MAG TPA: carbonic anhydrase [Acetobacteraceae bacterium]|nr:carbonic anhydrase [Acetobacteraceae bacterium]
MKQPAICRQCGFSHPGGFSRHGGFSRRALFGGGLATLALARTAFAAPSAMTSEGVPGDVALRQLMAGNARYAANRAQARDSDAGRAERLTAQHPIAAILSCADSRVAPEYVFDQGPGKLFVVRVAGNVLDDDGAASLEYAVKFLGVRLVVVLGHRNCGAVDAAIKTIKDGAELPGHLPGLIDAIKPAVLAAQATQPADLLAAAIAENVRQTEGHITTLTPILSAAASTGQLKVAGGVYDLANGRVNLL